jgi:hypothetical protein
VAIGAVLTFAAMPVASVVVFIPAVLVAAALKMAGVRRGTEKPRLRDARTS